ncbi:MAG: hypothetical protein M1834_009038 [Cirrosporium novae-zelandiae]|nr:MAG: hypothetical protein M1834_009038 [Cirrosporium novae-zelandiae]
MASKNLTDPSPEIVPDGLNKLWDAGDEAKVDIVFVHGLRGHPKTTWEGVDPGDGERIYWPKDLLPNIVPESRIFSFGYPTDFATFYPIVTPELIAHTTIDKNSTSLILKLGNRRRETHTETRPIIFVAHSLGGLICANGLSSYYGSDAQGPEVVNNTCGTIFLGTPFKGSNKAAWASMAEKFLRLFGDNNNQTTKDLDKDSKKLQQISLEFHMLLQQRYASKELNPIQVACFFESKSTKKTQWGMKIDLGKIVTAESATLAGCKPVAINANHLTICKFADDQTTGFIDVTDILKLMISNIDKTTEDPKKIGKTVISLGDVKQGDNVLSWGIITGHVVGTVKDANKLNILNTFNSFGGGSLVTDAAIKAWIQKKEAAEAKSGPTGS